LASPMSSFGGREPDLPEAGVVFAMVEFSTAPGVEMRDPGWSGI
jgi:hypothetical protein